MMSNSPLLSVIVPVYNTAPWLRRCLDSICAQSYRNLEILCVNDGSSDNSAEILAEYAAKDNRIKVIHQKNGGLSAARNTGLAHANGEWVTGVDSDDWIAPDTYQSAVACITPEVDMICFGAQLENADHLPNQDAVREYYRVKFEGLHEIGAETCFRTTVCFCNKMFRLSYIKKHNITFPVGLLYEDIPFYFCYVGIAKKAYYLTTPFYHYVQRDSSIMGQSMQKTPRSIDQLTGYEKVYHFYKKTNLLPIKQDILSQLFTYCYERVFWYIDDDSVVSARKKAYEIAKQTSVLKSIPSAICREIRNAVFPKWASWFIQSSRDKISFGIGRFHFLTIVFHRKAKSYWFMGYRIYTSTHN